MAMLKQYKHYIIALILLLCIKFFVPAANGLTDVGVNVLAVLVPILYLWLTVGTDWVSLLALAGVIISGVLSATDTYAASMGSSTIIIVITCMGLNKVLSDTGVIKKIAHWFLTRNLVRNRPYAFMAMFFLAATLLGLILECATLAIIFITLATEICDEIGYKKGDPFYTALIIGIFWVSNITNAATPICHAVPLIMVGTAAASGITISYTQWMTLGLPFAFLMYLLLLFVICVLWKPEASKYKNYDLDAARAKKIPLNKQGIISVVIFVLVVLAWIVPEVFPNLLPAAATAALKAWGNTVPANIAVCLLCVIHVDGIGLGGPHVPPDFYWCCRGFGQCGQFRRHGDLPGAQQPPCTDDRNPLSDDPGRYRGAAVPHHDQLCIQCGVHAPVLRARHPCGHRNLHQFGRRIHHYLPCGKLRLPGSIGCGYGASVLWAAAHHGKKHGEVEPHHDSFRVPGVHAGVVPPGECGSVIRQPQRPACYSRKPSGKDLFFAAGFLRPAGRPEAASAAPGCYRRNKIHKKRKNIPPWGL